MTTAMTAIKITDSGKDAVTDNDDDDDEQDKEK